MITSDRIRLLWSVLIVGTIIIIVSCDHITIHHYRNDMHKESLAIAAGAEMIVGS